MLRWFGHVERISESRLTHTLSHKADVSGNAGMGRPTRTYIDLIGLGGSSESSGA